MSEDARRYQDWVTVFSTGTDYEADFVRDRLDENGLAAVILTQRDHAFNLNVGDLAAVHVLVRPEEEEAALAILREAPLTDAELEEAAMGADIRAPDAHDAESEAMLDTGMDTLRLSAPDEDDYEDDEEEDDGGIVRD
jgi:hypothetical protein